MSGKRRLSDEEREQRRARDREAMKAAAEALLTSEGWRRWVRVRSRNGLARYSVSNQLAIAMACPGATFVAGFRAWIELGFCPVKGSKAIRIMAPMPVRERDPQTGEKIDETRVLFKAVSVFDRSQVTELPDREQAVLEPPCEPLTGESHAHLIEPIVAFAGSLGFAVSFEAIAGSAGGWCDSKNKRIVVDADAGRRAAADVDPLAEVAYSNLRNALASPWCDGDLWPCRSFRMQGEGGLATVVAEPRA